MPAGRRSVTTILMTSPSDTGTGGVQQVFGDLIRALEHEGRRVVLLHQAALPQLGVVRVDTRPGRDAFSCAMPTLVRDSILLGVAVSLVYLPLTLFHLVRFLRREKIDAINCHYLAEYFLHLVLAGRLLGIPVLVSVHGADVDRYVTARAATRWLLRLVVRGATRIVGCSAAMARQAVETFPAARGKATYVHNGLHLSDFAAAEDPPDIADPFVLCVCRQVDKKGVDTLLRAFARLAGEFADLGLVLIGDGPALERNRALARTLGIDHRVRFLGVMPRTRALGYLARCAVLAVPSRAEPFGLVILEGAYFSRPMVCTRAGGIPEIVEDHVSALLVDANDHAGMASRIALLLRDPALGVRLGERAHRELIAKFQWTARVGDYIATYEGADRRPSRIAVAAWPS